MKILEQYYRRACTRIQLENNKFYIKTWLINIKHGIPSQKMYEKIFIKNSQK